MASQSKVCFFFEVRAALAERTRLKKFIESIFKKENQKLQYVNYIFCSDKRVLDINRQFLKHDYYTDIITFDLSESAVITAEVYISVDRVRDNAKTLDVSFQQELHRVIFHGALHLCGYGDKTKKEREVMREKENLNLNLYK